MTAERIITPPKIAHIAGFSPTNRKINRIKSEFNLGLFCSSASAKNLDTYIWILYKFTIQKFPMEHLLIMDRRVFYLIEEFSIKPANHWTLKEMAQSVRLSERHLQKLFKSEAGVSPITFLRDLRLDRACRFLEDSSLLIKEIGVEIGMPNDSHFTRDFKKRYGMTPSDYRRKSWRKKQVKKKFA